MAQGALEQRQHQILEAIVNAPGSQDRLIKADDVALRLRFPLDEVEDAFKLLARRDMLRVNATMNGPLAAWSTAVGRQYLRDGAIYGTSGDRQVFNSHFYGTVGNAAVGNQGPTFQFAGDRTELRQAVDELRRTLMVDTALPAEERNDALDALDQVDEELSLEKPRRRRLISARETLCLVADTAGAAQGALMVRDGIETVLPLIEVLLRSAG